MLLLPHGYEGQGPDHSSARIERFMTLCADEAFVVAQPSTPASYFHLLRRHSLGEEHKPMVVFTPKSMADPAKVKWQADVTPGTALPTAWPKAAYEAFQADYQKERSALRKARRPESEMSALFTRERAFTNTLLSSDPNYRVVGAFEGANYEASGYFRPQMQCLMFDRSDAFCHVCRDGIGTIIDLYSR